MQPWFVPSCSKGFTQAELAIAVLVIGILAAIAAPNLSSWLQRKQLDDAFNQIDLSIQETQNEAIKRHQNCAVTLAKGPDPVISGNCLISGDRTLQGVTLDYSRAEAQWTITFDPDGENRNPGEDPGTLWLTATDRPQLRSRCMVISVGIGLRRIGQQPKNRDNCVSP